MSETETPRTDAVQLMPGAGYYEMLDLADTHKRELAAMTGRAELAERQVAVLCGFLSSLNVYLDGAPGKIEGWDAWSREQAAKEGGKG